MHRSGIALLFSLCIAAPASAQLYRWVDERGGVHYGDTPPAGARQVRQLDEDRSSVSVVPGLSKEDLERERQRLEQARIERLEREVAELQRAPAPAPAPPAPEHTTYSPSYYGYGYYGYPPYRRPPTPGHRPAKPQPKVVEPPAPPLYTRP